MQEYIYIKLSFSLSSSIYMQNQIYPIVDINGDLLTLLFFIAI
jgi:hypothetical protein